MDVSEVQMFKCSLSVYLQANIRNENLALAERDHTVERRRIIQGQPQGTNVK